MNKQIIENVVKKEGISKELLYKVETSIFKFIKDTMEAGKFEHIMLTKFGSFIVYERNKEKYLSAKRSNTTEGYEVIPTEVNNNRLVELGDDINRFEDEPQADAERKTQDLSTLPIE